MSFYDEVLTVQDSEVGHRKQEALATVQQAILEQARIGNHRLVLNNLLAGCSTTERRYLFWAANQIVKGGGFERSDYYVGESGRYQNASGDLYKFIIKWKFNS